MVGPSDNILIEGGLSEVNNRLVIEVINRLEGPITKTCPVFLEKSVCNVESKLRLGVEFIFRERTIGFQIFTCFGLNGMGELVGLVEKESYRIVSIWVKDEVKLWHVEL